MVRTEPAALDFLSRLETSAAITARLAHDFGNILTGILGFAELAMAELPTDSTAHEHVKEVHHSAQIGAAIIHKLQVFSRRTMPTYWPTTLDTVVAEEAERVRPQWAGAALTFDLASNLPQVAIDADSLRHLLAQLLDNAWESGLHGNQVTLRARTRTLLEADCAELIGAASPGSYVEIAVSDTGDGMPAEVRARLFHVPFYSTKLSRRGFGLAMVYGILRTFGGGLRIDPPSERGTTVRVFLPVAQHDATIDGTSVATRLAPVHVNVTEARRR